MVLDENRFQRPGPSRNFCHVHGVRQHRHIRVREVAIQSQFRFSHPVKIRLGSLHYVKSIEQARELLLHPAWPRRGPWHEDALYTTLEVFDGARPLSDAELSFSDAARESSILEK